MARRAKESEPSEPEREAGIVNVDEPPRLEDGSPKVEPRPEPPPSPPVVPPEAPPGAPSGPSFGERVGRFFRFLFRLISLVILLSLLSLALYLLLPWLYQTFVRPVEQNTAQVRELQTRQAQLEQDVADLQTKLGTFESVQNGHDGSLTKLDQRVSQIETETAARTRSLTELEEMLTKIQAQNDATSAELERQIKLLKGMELLSRARLFMYQSNFGLAEQDIQIARDLLATLQPGAPQPLARELEAVIQRLDMALSNLPDFPVAASDDLDIAWQILLSGLPQVTPTVSVTVSPTGTLSVTPTVKATQVTVTVSSTPPVTTTVQPSPTP